MTEAMLAMSATPWMGMRAFSRADGSSSHEASRS
jgi:hypothetical protein